MVQLEDLLQQCTVQITIPGQPGWGTGFFVAPGLILTCTHVVKTLNVGATAKIRWQQQLDFAPAELLQIESQLDLALLRFTTTNTDLPCVYLEGLIQVGHELYFFGYPDQDFDHGCPVTGSCEGFTGDMPPLIKFKQAQVRPGMSGSALLNRHTGKVCGMVKFTRDRSIDLGGGAIPTHVILEQFPQLRELQREFHQRDRRWHNLVTAQSEVDFQPYLRSILDTQDYRDWQELYTPTTVEDKKSSQRVGIAKLPPPTFSPRLKLRVETVKLPQQGRDGAPDVKAEERKQAEQWDVLEGLRQYATNHVLLIGKPGSGKSTSLKRLLWEEATHALQNPDARIPVLVKLRRCTATIEGLIRDFLSRHHLALELAHIESLLQQGKILLLLDGLNELPEAFSTEIANFRDRCCRTTPMIISTRDLSVGGTLGVEKTLKMLPLTEPQMQEFVRGYLGNDGNRLFQQLEGDRLRKFAEVPLLLWMLCRVFAKSGKVPANLGLAFREFTQLHDHEIQQDAPAGSQKHWHKLLRHLAFALMQGKTLTDFRLSMSREEAENCLTDYLQQEGRANPRDCAERWLEDLLKYHLIQPVIQDNFEEHIEFRHQLIQEYYAAEYLLRLFENLPDETLTQDYLNYLKWTEPVALMLALVKKEALALQVVKLAANNVDLMVGARLAGEARHDLQNQTVNLIDNSAIPLKLKAQLFGLTKSLAALPFLSQSLDKADSFVRGESIRAITKIDSIDSINLLRKALNDKDPKNRYLAANGLAKLSDATATSVLQEALYDKEHHTNALFSIAKLSPEKVIPLLGQIFKDGSSEARLKATTSLHLLLGKGYEGILPLSEIVPLLEVALHDEASQVRYAAAHALMNAGSEEAISILSQAWADKDTSVQNIVCIALKNCVGKYLENSLKEALLGNSASLRKQAIEVIRRINLDSRSVIEALLGVAFYDTDFLIRSSAKSALVMIGRSCVTNALGEILEQEELKIREYESSHLAAVSLLSLIRSGEPIPILTKVLSDQGKDVVVRICAIKALGKIGDQSIIQNLIDHWSASTSLENWLIEGIYVETILALGKLGIQGLEDEIIAIIKNSTSSDTCKEAVEVLGRSLTEKAINYLHKALTESDFSVRFPAALILAEQNNVGSIPVLIEALGKRDSIGFEDSTVCEKAINALCRIGDEALEKLEYALNDQDFQVKQHAELAISKIKGEAAPIDYLDVSVNQSADDYADTLINQLTSKHNFVELLHALSAVTPDEAWQFSSALMKISQPEQISFLLRFMLDSDSNNVFYYVPGIISTVQNRCKFYNYEAWKAAVRNQERANLVKRTQQMASEPKNNFGGATFNGPVNFGDNPTGDFISTQNNYAADPEVQGEIVDQ